MFTLVRRFETGAGAPPRPISSGEALREQLRDGGGRAVEKKNVFCKTLRNAVYVEFRAVQKCVKLV